jgi:hypothetical protein
MSSLPQSILAMVEFVPVEDLLLPILREALPDVAVQSLIEDEHDTFPFVLVRGRTNVTDSWDGDPRFIDIAMVAVHTFAEGLNSDQDAALLSEAVRVALRDAARRRVTVPGAGTLLEAKHRARPVRGSPRRDEPLRVHLPRRLAQAALTPTPTRP